ncbi:hypothetical protein CK203_027892 [Vitis vinifera]|uniref:Integrase catalytic domain-containing protein n=1 Tax=Vitis vinifera TaxID=29760 RepID=A0A438J3V8_VITVI|nr:hypothetical protein CK203_027892 [Vitis vinifera]
MLRGVSTCGWTDECKQTFEVVKRYLIEPPIRSSPKSDKQLYMYLVVSDCVAHQVIVLTNQPLRVTLHKLDLSGRMLTWAIELSEHGIKYQSRASGSRVGRENYPKTGSKRTDFAYRSPRFTLINDHLYRQSFGGPYLRCLSDLKPKYVLTELHEGVCGNHPSGQTLVHCAHTYAPIPHIPSEALNPITSPWLFVLWGMDKIDPLLVVVAQKKFLLVATDYFSKWVEAEDYANIKDKDVSKFVWKKHHVSVRSPMSDCGRYWTAIWQYRLPNILLGVKH